jgi:catechol 2,3-dioxygenase-like lactoylglutathione lyase family enzyme
MLKRFPLDPSASLHKDISVPHTVHNGSLGETEELTLETSDTRPDRTAKRALIGSFAMGSTRRFDHVGITVADLESVTEFFAGLGFEVEGTTAVEGEFLDTVIGIPGSRTEIVMLRLPGEGTALELSSFVRPDHQPGSPEAMANELGIRNIAFEVDDLQGLVDRLAADGYELVGGVGQYEKVWRMAYVRGPEGIIVSLAERIG